MYIKVYVTEAEKEHLQEVSRLKKMSLSELYYRQLDPLLKTPAHRFLTVEQPSGITEGKNVLVHLTADEYAQVLRQAHGMALSRYFRKILLNQKEPVKIQVYTEDISLLTMRVSKYIDQLYSFIAALAIRQQLYEADYERLIQIADDTRIALREAATYAKKNRDSIRNTGIRYLRKELQRAVKEVMNGFYTPKP